MVFCFITFQLAAHAFAEPNLDFENPYPDLTDPNMMARTYLNPNYGALDHVTEGLVAVVGYGTSSDNMQYFYGNNNVSDPIANTNFITVSLHEGFQIPLGGDKAPLKMEIGGTIRSYQDVDKNLMSIFLAEFHSINKKLEENIPQGDPYTGDLGPRTVLIGPDGKFYFTTADVYAKLQLLQEGPTTPNLAIKLSVKIPLTNISFDTAGVAATVGASKKLSKVVCVLFSATVGHEDTGLARFQLTPQDGIEVNPYFADVFGGLYFALGKGWSISTGYRLDTVRIRSMANPGGTRFSQVIPLKISYTDEKNRWGIELNAQEDNPLPAAGPFKNNEPDFQAWLGATFGI